MTTTRTTDTMAYLRSLSATYTRIWDAMSDAFLPPASFDDITPGATVCVRPVPDTWHAGLVVETRGRRAVVVYIPAGDDRPRVARVGIEHLLLSAPVCAYDDCPCLLDPQHGDPVTGHSGARYCGPLCRDLARDADDLATTGAR